MVAKQNGHMVHILGANSGWDTMPFLAEQLPTGSKPFFPRKHLTICVHS